MNAGLILAGGKGERLTGYSTPKQFLEVGGRPVISYCLQTFQSCSDIDIICVVADEKWHTQIGNFLFAEPGISRQHSIYNGLKALQSFTPQYVVIHDAARPCVLTSTISECIAASRPYDGATPVLPVTETIYRSACGQVIAAALKRDELFVGQTPECYDFSLYLAAHERFASKLSDFRGSSEIAVNADMRIALAKGDPGNFKITTNTDLERFKSIINGGHI